MRRLPRLLAAGLAVAGLLFAAPLPARAQTSKPVAHKTEPHRTEVQHRIVFQVDQNDPAIMNLLINNAENLSKYYQSKGEPAEMEFVAFGPGLAMVRSDISPVKDRLAALTSSTKNLVVSGCGNTMSNQSQQENKEITLLPEARIVPTGIGRIVELQEQGWTYVRP
jgi:intracellular sulfur oxidation DsrE/DsrF family protein